jgi:uncharacterized membrane protein YhaH (DUF805 family)
MTFSESIKTVVFKKYATFKGRASRSEYWWYSLFASLIALLGAVIANTLYGDPSELTLFDIVSLLLLLPGLAVSIRRLHDVNKSGWWLLYPWLGLILVPIASLFDDTSLMDSMVVISFSLMTLGYLYVLYLAIKKSDSGENQYGKNPVEG